MPSPARTKWSSDAFLDTMRAAGDLHADQCVAELGTSSDYAALFRVLTYNDEPLPAGTPEPLVRFFAETRGYPAVESDRVRFPDGIDHDRIKRGERVFLDHAAAVCLVLLAKALPEGYAAPCLSKLLCLSGNLQHHPYRRLLGVLQLVVNVCAEGGFEKDGIALMTAQQVRLMHAGIRRLVPKYLPQYQSQHGIPVNLEDMLGTVMGLSLLVIEGMPRLHDALEPKEAEDYYYMWRVFAHSMGIHPPGRADSHEWVPATIAEATEFYESYARRHYASTPEVNPDGAELARDNMQMLVDMLPRFLRKTPFAQLPAYCATVLIGDAGCKRVGIVPVDHPTLIDQLAEVAFFLGATFWHAVDRIDPRGHLHPTLSHIFLQGMIFVDFGGKVSFMIPESLDDVRDLVQRPVA